MSSSDAAPQQQITPVDVDNSQTSTNVIVTAPAAPRPPRDPPVSEPNKRPKINTHPKSISVADTVSAPSGTQLTYLEPILMRPAQHRVKDFLDACSDSLIPSLSNSSQSTFKADLLKIFAYNLDSKMKAILETYIPQGYKHVVEPVVVPWTVARLLESYSAYEPDKGTAPPMLPDSSWIMTDLSNRGIETPSGAELPGLLGRWTRYEKEIAKDYPNAFVDKSGTSLLFAGVLDSLCGNTTVYNVVSQVKLTRWEELLVGFIRPRGFTEPAPGMYLPRLLPSETRSLPSVAGYFKAAEPFDDSKFVTEFLMSTFHRA